MKQNPAFVLIISMALGLAWSAKGATSEKAGAPVADCVPAAGEPLGGTVPAAFAGLVGATGKIAGDLARPKLATEFASITRHIRAFRHPDPNVVALFSSGLLSTGRLLTPAEAGAVYVKTGDIPAEWLRDSSAQVRTYLYYAKEDPELRAVLKGVILHQARGLLTDPYANAFGSDYKVWERKFELDSLAYPILLAWTYWKVTGDSSVFTPDVKAGYEKALATMQQEQDHPGKAGQNPSPYAFPSDGTQVAGVNPVGHTGMIWTGFRPSDDPSTYNFLIPSEMQAVQALAALQEIESKIFKDQRKAAEAAKLRREVHSGIQKFGIVPDKGNAGRLIYAFEVDGLGHSVLMDDANLPSLLSAPYFGYVSAMNPVYQNTRKFILSNRNPFFVSGGRASGVGSPHTPEGTIWPLAILARGLTTKNQQEKDDALKMLLASVPGDHLLHESFDPGLPGVAATPREKPFCTRDDFGWPNSLFAEFILSSYEKKAPLPVPGTDDLVFRRK